MQVFENYHMPVTVEQALALLAHYEGRARVVAGGTDLLVDSQAEFYQGHRPHFDALVDVTRIAGANEIREQDGFLVIGCGVTHTQIVAASLVQSRATALAEACLVVGGPQVRNVATLCGNVAHALPAADGTVALMALDAEAQVVSQGVGGANYMWRPLASLFRGPAESAVDSTRELIAAVRFRPTGAQAASAFVRVMRPQGVALPILGLATRVKMDGETLVEVAVSAGPVAPVPFRATRTEAYLMGKRLTAETLREATRALLAEARPRTSPHRATRDYRLELLPTLLEQTLRAAAARAQKVM